MCKSPCAWFRRSTSPNFPAGRITDFAPLVFHDGRNSKLCLPAQQGYTSRMKGKACLLALGLVLAVLPCRSDEAEKSVSAIAPLISHVASHRDGSVAWSIDFSKFDRDRSSLPVGVFDSGIGGLTVMEAILKLDAFNNRTLQPGADGVPDFAGEKFIYLGDQANMPYGNYPAKGREDYLRELIVKDAVFLLGKRHYSRGEACFDKPPVKAIVIACNTATAYGLEDIRAALREWKLEVPVIGVVEAGARAVSESLPADGMAGAVAVLATVGTCNVGAYPKAIERAGGLAGKSIPTMVQQGCVGLAGAIEGNPAFVSSTANGANWPVSYLGPAVGIIAFRCGFCPPGRRSTRSKKAPDATRPFVVTVALTGPLIPHA